MAPSEPDFIGDCPVCGQPRLAYTSKMQMKEGAADWTDLTAITVKCNCGRDSPTDLDLARLRERRFESAMEAYTADRRSGDRLKGEALNQAYALFRVGHANPLGSLLGRVRTYNKGLGGRDELMEQYVAEALLLAEKAWKRESKDER